MHVTLYVDLAIAVIFSYQVSLNHFKWLPRYKSEINQAYGSGEITENEEKQELSFWHVTLCMDLFYDPSKFP